MQISATVMAHPSRRAHAERLAASLDRFGASVTLDPDPGGEPSAMRTAELAWAAAGDADYHLVVQDDVVLCADFPARLEAVGGHGFDLVSLFADWGTSNGQSVRLAALQSFGVARIVQASIPPQAVLLRSDSAQEFAELCGEARRNGESRDSKMLCQFAAMRGLRAGISVPNLVQHDLVHVQSIWPEKVRRGPIRSAFFADDTAGWAPAGSGAGELAPSGAVPYVGWEIDARVATPTRLGSPPSETSAVGWLAEHGADEVSLVGAFHEVWRDVWPTDPPLTRPALYEVFLASAAAGSSLSGRGVSCGPAIETVVPGALRNVVDFAALPDLRAEAAEFVARSMQYGAAAVGRTGE